MKLNCNRHKVYIAKLKRKNKTPAIVLKIGITSFMDALLRLTYSQQDEPHPIVSEFEDIKIMASVIFDCKEKAEKVEKQLMSLIAGNNAFHNWHEPRPLSGITEMRIWNYAEFLLAITELNKYKCPSD